MHNRELKNLVGTKGFIRVEVTRWNPSGQVEIKPLCSNCDGKVAWVKPEDIIQACDEKIEVPETWNSLSKKPAENEKYCLKADTKKMLTAGREETLEMLKKKFIEIARQPSNGGIFHIAEILNIIEMEKDSNEPRT